MSTVVAKRGTGTSRFTEARRAKAAAKKAEKEAEERKVAIAEKEKNAMKKVGMENQVAVDEKEANANEKKVAAMENVDTDKKDAQVEGENSEAAVVETKVKERQGSIDSDADAAAEDWADISETEEDLRRAYVKSIFRRVHETLENMKDITERRKR
ncbi:hypothetical protein GCG54_00012999 [Colletotrichum gloeosporioides]|uniref:Uncharacterized protein n=1 Tax=Colletotrichum gloeosporioides TaxID=474922 RepID=A0A8H4CQN9_COLGL|nr:uncharacterized protein GCG54_00012999 [Colletotrichum gloeosporioides]KAF3808361.1 hypothetical protein GCG54_00012999 [Colletotrichum gloeosporioides]